MRIFTKTNNGLRHLGEGRIYSKGQVRLIESDDVIADATPNGESINTSTLGSVADKQFNNNSSVSAVSVRAGELGSGNKNDAVSGTLDLKQSELSAKKSLIDTVAKTSPNTQINIHRENKSVVDNRRISEMRKSSIPFTKKEMTDFLREL